MEMTTRERIAQHAQARVGTTLKERWQLTELLGVGGMGAVYRGVHRNGSAVAVKVLHAHLADDPAIRARFLREGYIANAVKHPGVVGVIDDDVDADTAFLIAELVEGRTLEQMRRDAPEEKLLPRVVLGVMSELLEVLERAHGAGIVHRDLKPENLMVASDRLRVLDFGLACARDLLTLEAEITGSTPFLGSPHFCAPEQAAGRWKLVDAQTDLWAVGAIAFRLLSGQHVFAGQNAQEALVRAATEPAMSLAEALPQAHGALVRWVDRALSFSKSDRFPNAAEMHEALLRVAAELEIELIPTGARSSTQPPRNVEEQSAPTRLVRTTPPSGKPSDGPTAHRRAWLWGLGLLACIGAAWVWLSFQGPQADPVLRIKSFPQLESPQVPAASVDAVSSVSNLPPASAKTSPAPPSPRPPPRPSSIGADPPAATADSSAGVAAPNVLDRRK